MGGKLLDNFSTIVSKVKVRVNKVNWQIMGNWGNLNIFMILEEAKLVIMIFGVNKCMYLWDIQRKDNKGYKLEGNEKWKSKEKWIW